MNLYNKLGRTFSIAVVSLLVTNFPAAAHESRIVTNDNGAELRITVGNQPEPVFAGQLSRTDLILNQLDSNGNSIPVDVSAGASIENLHAHVLFLKEEMHVDSLNDPLVLKAMELHDIAQVSGTDNRYQTPIIYTEPGAYGFRYMGKIITNDGTEFDVDEFFICGGGSMAEPRADGSVPAFGCVAKPVTFPGEFDHHKKDKDKEHKGKKDKDDD